MDGDRNEARAALLVEVNDEIRTIAGRRHDAPLAQEWEFYCECVDPSCTQTITVSLAEYDERKSRGRPIVAPGHPAARAREARAESAARREDAEALRAQARLQLGRANRLKPG